MDTDEHRWTQMNTDQMMIKALSSALKAKSRTKSCFHHEGHEAHEEINLSATNWAKYMFDIWSSSHFVSFVVLIF
jgi:hypothetical protein